MNLLVSKALRDAKELQHGSILLEVLDIVGNEISRGFKERSGVNEAHY